MSRLISSVLLGGVLIYSGFSIGSDGYSVVEIDSMVSVVDQLVDTDNDGIADNYDGYPLISIEGYQDWDMDGIPDVCDTPCQSLGMVADTLIDFDYDGDGLQNQDEVVRGTDVYRKDTDNDRMDDGYEVSNELNPLIDDAAIIVDGKTNIQNYIESVYPYDFSWVRQYISHDAGVYIEYRNYLGSLRGDLVTYGNSSTCNGRCSKWDYYFLKSSDGNEWSAVKTNFRAIEQGKYLALYDFSGSADLMLAVGRGRNSLQEESLGAIYSSADGATWATRYVDPKNTIISSAWGNDIFVALGGDTVVRSNDGINWSAADDYIIDLSEYPYQHSYSDGSNFHVSFSAVVYGNGKFLATASGACSDGADVYYQCPGYVDEIILISENGEYWKALANNPDDCSFLDPENQCSFRINPFGSVEKTVHFSNGMFYWHGLKSVDGMNWVKHNNMSEPTFISRTGVRFSISNVGIYYGNTPAPLKTYIGDEFGQYLFTGDVARILNTNAFGGMADMGGKVYAQLNQSLYRFEIIDDDSDGLPNHFELANGLNPFGSNDADLDSDEDGLSNVAEYIIGTSINESDTDNDEISDYIENSYGFLNPLEPGDAILDQDGDGYSNLVEVQQGTSLVNSVDYPGSNFIVESDFNNDGKSDLFWRNQHTGATDIWTMNGSEILSTASIGTIPDTNWTVAAINDFDGDGDSDLLWHHATQGRTSLWTIEGGNVIAKQSIGTISDPVWQIVSTGDYDGDGDADVLWHHPGFGGTSLWSMENGVVLSRSSIGAVPGGHWLVNQSGDYNSDGTDDILWRNKTTGATSLWTMENTLVQTKASIGTVNDLNWKIAASGDFDADGDADILWHHAVYGWTSLWSLDNASVASRSSIGTISDNQWSVNRSGDYDGDGNADLLWRNQSSGATSLWLLESGAVQSQQSIGSITRDWL